MKNLRIINLTALVLMAGLLFTGCNQQEKNNKGNSEQLEELKTELKDVKEEVSELASNETKDFKVKAQVTLDRFNAKVDSFEKQAEETGEKISTETEEKIADLKREADRIEEKLEALGEATLEEMKKFRQEVKHDFREFGESLGNFFEDNA